jgi:protein-disulfide isomerase
LAFTAGKLKGFAKDLGLNGQRFDQCLDSGKYLNKVEQETGIGSLLGASGTPAFFLNGKLLAGAQPFRVFEAVIEEELKKTSAPPKSKS